MLSMLADLLTLARVAAAGILIWLGVRAGAAALPTVVWVIVLGWTSDQLDGWVARRSPTPTRLKDYDFQVDVLFYAGILAYLVTARFLPAWGTVGFVAVGVIAWLTTRRKAVGILWLRIVDVICGVIIFANMPVVGFLLLGWLGVLSVIYRRRLVERVPRWFGDVRDAWRRRV